VQELQQRKNVLKKALQREDKLEEQLKAQGQSYSAQQQQQWMQMYAEYKEIKQVLQAVGEAEAAEAAGQQSAVIDLT
jgi:transcriptional accessory protein Tex/SPT6